MIAYAALAPDKFQDPDVTADGAQRAAVRLGALDTLWFNTGTLCNIECRNCYIESSPLNERLTYMTAAEVRSYLDEIEALSLGTAEIGFTGGEPFMNPELLQMLEDALQRGFKVQVLTNAMRPLMRPAVCQPLLALRERFAEALHLRVSLDHYTERLHNTERGAGSWTSTLEGLRWLAASGFSISVAGRTCWEESEATARVGYRQLFDELAVSINADDPGALVLFPEMDANVDVPEITVDCWETLGLHAADMMCASSRMVVKRKDAPSPAVVACTLLPYDRQFELGSRLAEALGTVKLNHPHCAKFCVLGGGSCSPTGVQAIS